MENPDLPGYLRGEDLQQDGKWAEFTMEITEALPPNTVRSASKELIDKPILAFHGAGKRFVVGDTNERLIKAQLGNRPKEWPGKKITLYPVAGDWFGQKDAIAVRVRVPAGVPRPFISKKNLGRDITGQPIGKRI